MNITILLSVFVAGMVATINPCGFAMLPAYISYFLNLEGSGEQAPGSGTGGWRRAVAAAGRTPPLFKALLIGATTTAGFLTLFVAAGILISLGARVLVRAVPWAGLSIGFLLLLLGIWLVTGRHLSVPAVLSLKFEKRRNLKSFFLFGLAYGLASLTCTLPLFLALVGSVFAAGGVAQAAGQFLSYSLGMGLVLIALTLSLAFFKGMLIAHLRRLVRYVERASAVLLLGAGGYLVYYWLFVGRLIDRILPA